MKKVYVILIFACVLANAMNNQYENLYNERTHEFLKQPILESSNHNQYNNPTTYNNSQENRYVEQENQMSLEYFLKQYKEIDNGSRNNNPIQNIGGIKDKIRTEEHETDYFKELQRQNRYEENYKGKNEGNGKMMALSFVIGLLVGASAALAWHFATKEVVKAEGEEAESEKAEGEEAKGEDDEEKQCQHAIKENDAVINVQDLKNQNAAEYANQPETTY